MKSGSGIIPQEIVEKGQVQSLMHSPDLKEEIIPSFEVNPSLVREVNFVNGASRNTSGSFSYTLPTGIIYLHGFVFSFIKDANCDLATGNIAVIAEVLPQVTGTLLSIPTITLTAQSDTVSVFFARPIRLKSASNVTCAGTFTAGVYSRNLILYLTVEQR